MSRGLSLSDLPPEIRRRIAPEAPRSRGPRRDVEHQEQVALFAWATAEAERIPELGLLFAIPNFARLRTKREAAKRKAEGLKAGVPDVLLPVARGGYHALFVELKVAPNRPTRAQRLWIESLRAQGYKAEVRYGFEATRDEILDYLSL